MVVVVVVVVVALAVLNGVMVVVMEMVGVVAEVERLAVVWTVVAVGVSGSMRTVTAQCTLRLRYHGHVTRSRSGELSAVEDNDRVVLQGCCFYMIVSKYKQNKERKTNKTKWVYVHTTSRFLLRRQKNTILVTFPDRN